MGVRDEESNQYRCPLCDHLPAKKFYFTDRVGNVGGNIDAGELIPSGGANLDLIPHPQLNFYYDCSGCNHQYEDISDIDFENIMAGIKISQIATSDSRFYYGAIELTQLLRNWRTGIIKRKRNAISYLGKKSEKILICLRYDNIRTYASCKLQTDKRKHSHYEVMNLVRV